MSILLVVYYNNISASPTYTMQEDWVNLGPDYVSNIPGYTSNNAFSASMDTIFDLYSYINGIFINLLQTSQISGYQIDLSLL